MIGRGKLKINYWQNSNGSMIKKTLTKVKVFKIASFKIIAVIPAR